jgi:DNA-binding PadR family transcriptional regulator
LSSLQHLIDPPRVAEPTGGRVVRPLDERQPKPKPKPEPKAKRLAKRLPVSVAAPVPATKQAPVKARAAPAPTPAKQAPKPSPRRAAREARRAEREGHRAARQIRLDQEAAARDQGRRALHELLSKERESNQRIACLATEERSARLMHGAKKAALEEARRAHAALRSARWAEANRLKALLHPVRKQLDAPRPLYCTAGRVELLGLLTAGPRSWRELLDRLGIKLSSFKGRMRGLCLDGLVTSSGARRHFVYALTDSGRAMLSLAGAA